MHNGITITRSRTLLRQLRLCGTGSESPNLLYPTYVEADYRMGSVFYSNVWEMRDLNNASYEVLFGKRNTRDEFKNNTPEDHWNIF